MVEKKKKYNIMDLLELRRELLKTIDNRQSSKEDLIKTMEEVSGKLLRLHHASDTIDLIEIQVKQKNPSWSNADIRSKAVRMHFLNEAL